MHDPMTVAHEIKYPWWNARPWPKKARRWDDLTESEKVGRSQFWKDGYRDTFITIWHVDPERDGSDDSCGWAWPKLSKAQQERMHNLAFHEAREPWFQAAYTKKNDSPADAESLMRGAIVLVARVLGLRFSLDQATKLAIELIHNPGNSCRGMLCHIPGYHTNFKEDSPEHREYEAERLYGCIARHILGELRPWWRHPRWHIHHWRIQCNPLQSFKRWAFSRCCRCGGRFTWGYAPISNNWNAKGPRWFRSEPDVYHSDCNHPADNCVTHSHSSGSVTVAAKKAEGNER